MRVTSIFIKQSQGAKFRLDAGTSVNILNIAIKRKPLDTESYPFSAKHH